MTDRGPIEAAVRSTIRSGTVLATPAQGARFEVGVVDDDGLVLLIGEQQTPTGISWHVLEGINGLLAGGKWIPIGSSYSTTATPGTLDAHLKTHVNRAIAGWVAAVLEEAGVVDIDRRRPGRLRRR